MFCYKKKNSFYANFGGDKHIFSSQLAGVEVLFQNLEKDQGFASHVFLYREERFSGYVAVNINRQKANKSSADLSDNMLIRVELGRVDKPISRVQRDSQGGSELVVVYCLKRVKMFYFIPSKNSF